MPEEYKPFVFGKDGSFNASCTPYNDFISAKRWADETAGYAVYNYHVGIYHNDKCVYAVGGLK